MAEIDSSRSPRVCLLSAYRSDSHAAWAEWLTTNLTEFDWQVRELPGRHFSWRIRGNPLSWLDVLPEETPDRIIATSMVDLATIRGLHPRLAGVPGILYFHENQFAYPRSDRQVTSLDAQMVQIYGALAADRVLFNSEFNRRTFLEGVEELLARMPDRVPGGIGRRIEEKCGVLPVPIEPIPQAESRDERLIAWNHRWEYDKDPARFADAMIELAGRGVEFRLALMGARPRKTPEPLLRLRERLHDRVVADGKLSRDEYRRILGRAGIAVSTARHEFQGLAMLEAASAGARPLVPDALCYREQYPEQYRYPPGDGTLLEDKLTEWLNDGLPAAVDVSHWTSQRLIAAWRDTVMDCPHQVPVPARPGLKEPGIA